MNTRQTIAKNTILQVSLQFFNLLAGLYSVSLIAKYLGHINFGKYGFISSFYFFFIACLDLGIGAIVIREIAQERKNAGLVLGNVMTFRLLLSILLAFVAIAIANIFPFPDDLRTALALYAPILLFIALESLQTIFEADLRYEYIALAAFFWRISSLLFVLLAVRLNLGLAFIVISFVSAEAIKYLTLYLSSKKLITIKLPAIDIKLWMEMMKKGLPIGITTILITIIRNMDTMMLTKLKGFAEVGLYLAPYRLCDMSLSLPLALMGSIFPLMSKSYKHNLNALKQIHQESFDILSVCGILLTVLVLALADKIIISIYGLGFVRSIPCFRILIFSALLVYLNIASGSLLIAADKQRAIMWFYFLCAPLNIVLNLILIPHFSFIGAAISNIIVMFLAMPFTFYVVRTKVGISLGIRKIKKAAIAGLITLVILFFFKGFNLFISLPIGIILYSSLVVYLKAVDIDDLIVLVENRIPGIKKLKYSLSNKKNLWK